MFAVIGGSGLARLAGLQDSRREVVRTPHGDPSGPLTFGRLDGHEIVFIARHGYGHILAPHEINYRANLWALKEADVEGILAVATVGGIRLDFGPGVLVVPDQLIDYTHGRRGTFFEGPEVPVTHIDFTQPFDDGIRRRFILAAGRIGQPVAVGGTYGCTQGPRLETAAEIRRLQRDGCDLVGMTVMPEAALARELEIPYAVLSVVVNHAAGIGDSATRIAHESMERILDQAMAGVRAVLSEALKPGAV